MSILQFESYTKSWIQSHWSEEALPLHFDHRKDFFSGIEKLWSSQKYSLLSGGKRFRPQLVLAVAESLGLAAEKFYPWALAIEMIHTYSLIHDDLPSMDNDDLRRGQPTNHKVFGEAAALLAGDSLLTEAFSLLSREYRLQPNTAVELISVLSESAGWRGMVGGQAWDLFSAIKLNKNEIIELHYFKTAALIRAAIEGAAVIAGLNTESRQGLRNYAELIGLAFQVQDDILDFSEKDEGQKNLAQSLGRPEAELVLQQTSQKALQQLQELALTGISSWQPLIQLIEKNQKRTV